MHSAAMIGILEQPFSQLIRLVPFIVNALATARLKDTGTTVFSLSGELLKLCDVWLITMLDVLYASVKLLLAVLSSDLPLTRLGSSWPPL